MRARLLRPLRAAYFPPNCPHPGEPLSIKPLSQRLKPVRNSQFLAIVNDLGELGRKRTIKVEECAPDRMHESKMRSMQRPAGQSGKFAAQRLGKLAQLGLEAGAVKRIADQRVADRAQMHAHLMRAPGLERAFEQRGDLLFS